MRRLLAVLLALSLLAGACSGDDGPEPQPPDTPSESTPPTLPAERAFVVASFNVLGATHTRPDGGQRADWPSAIERVPGQKALIDRHQPDVIALQELQPPRQSRAFRRALGDGYGYAAETDNAVMWRRSVFEKVGQTSIDVPYFYGTLKPMPVVRLRHRETGTLVTVLSIHNPAENFGEAAGFRADAVRRERAFVEAERARGRVILLLGDFNAEREAFCPLARGGLLTSANGGSHDDGCVPPEETQIDWIFGAGVEFTGYANDGSPYGDRVSDHAFIAATVGRFT